MDEDEENGSLTQGSSMDKRQALFEISANKFSYIPINELGVRFSRYLYACTCLLLLSHTQSIDDDIILHEL